MKKQRVSPGVVDAVRSLRTEIQAPTIREVAAFLVQERGMALGGSIVQETVRNMNRHGKLRIVRTRRVDYRNRPVAEYDLVDPMDAADQGNSTGGNGFVDLAAAWGGASSSSSITKTIKD